MKAVLISIQPKWCELIASGEKTIEVRKTRPKIETPFKCYIYCTKQKTIADEYCGNRNGHIYIDNGKVIGEFVCDMIEEIDGYPDCDIVVQPADLVEKACLTQEQAFKYIGYGTGYGWYIFDLKIYDKPKELSDFGNYKIEWVEWYGCDDKVFNPLRRPPQSWCYVEELE